ncbi:MAG: T9SS type A sorting domain-containing protein, partial [Bacteroidales bacterium]|nr:T9SS type A sorting domain-containing protein [Bacteroidales bacterium]
LTAYPMQACQDIDDDDMTLTIELYSGLEFVESDDLLLKVSPNPATGTVNITGSSPEGDITLQVINSTGKIIFNGIFKTEGNQLNRQLDITYLKNGIYYVRLTSSSAATTIKLIKL